MSGRLPVTVAAVLTVALTACAEPELPEGTNEQGAEQPLEAEQLDPTRDVLVAELERLTRSVTDAREDLQEALDAGHVAAARAAGLDAVAQLVDAPDLAGVDTDAPPLFPGETADRAASADARDTLTSTLTAARDTGDPLGRAVVDSLQDPIAGDLGAWQRDAAGVVDLVRGTVGSETDLDALEAAVLELPGEGTRALAWALAASEAGSAEEAAAFAERGIAHLDIVLAALDALETGPSGGDGNDA